ncbi:calcium-binding protein [Neogemmobacter tilapiae]|uniref:Calcium-binding protein n=1 Tax=Neogemmobacter tilapiae TaxID=875041 RepID=A0A918TLE1_9RHOB|nr:hypothetical protein [Gemmobacter tilapiae]GHC53295.1 hypothetical protein GCM10007315_14930 [Gemmobacter tilapiae]
MAFVELVGTAFFNPGEEDGAEDDVVYVPYQNTVYNFAIFTYAGNDWIDLRDANPNAVNTQVYSGLGNDTVYGSATMDLVYDSKGRDRVYLGDSDDSLDAGFGNDFYDGGAGRDFISFYILHDSDLPSGTNITGVKFDLQIRTAQNLGPFGTDVIVGFEGAGGGNGHDTLSGTRGDNVLSGNEGNDFLVGRGGDDQLLAGAGRDTLIGGVGGDALSLTESIQSSDIVRFLSMGDSGVGMRNGVVDRIYGFAAGGTPLHDKIDLRALDAIAATAKNDAFLFRDTGPFTSAKGEIRYEVSSAGNILVHVDTDGDAAAEMNFWVMGVTVLTSADFML